MLPIILLIQDEADRDLVSEIYENYGKHLYVIALGILNNPEDAEDCVHDVIDALIDNLEKVKALGSDHQIKYIIKCCRNIAINKYYVNRIKRNNENSLTYPEDETDIDIPDDNSDVGRLVIDAENSNRLLALIKGLPEIYGDALYLRYYVGMTNSKIAKMMGVSVHAVEIRISRAKKMLRETKGDELNDIRRK